MAQCLGYGDKQRRCSGFGFNNRRAVIGGDRAVAEVAATDGDGAATRVANI